MPADSSATDRLSGIQSLGSEVTMKGIVFSEFIEMVEDTFSPEIADRIIEQADLPSGGAYTSVGTYDHTEIIELVSKLSKETDVPVADLVRAFGVHLAARFSSLYPGFFEGADSSFSFLETIEDHVHKEVRKLYPDAELPTFSTKRINDTRMDMVYESKRPFADLAQGLIEGCASHFGESVNVERTDGREGELYKTRFSLTRTA